MKKISIITIVLILLCICLWLVYITRINNYIRPALTNVTSTTPQTGATPSIQPGWHYAIYKMWGQSPTTGEGATLNVGVSLPPNLEYSNEGTSSDIFRVINNTSRYWMIDISLIDKSKVSIKQQYIDWIEKWETSKCTEASSKQTKYNSNASYIDVNIICSSLYENGPTYTAYGAYLMETSGFVVRINKYKDMEHPANVVSSNLEIEPYLPDIFASLTITN